MVSDELVQDYFDAMFKIRASNNITIKEAKIILKEKLNVISDSVATTHFNFLMGKGFISINMGYVRVADNLDYAYEIFKKR
jgi:hypothetical protein